jgi:hypothetical protein
MTTEDFKKVLEMAPMIRNFLKSVEEEALLRLKKGATIPGFKLGVGNSRREWKLEEEQLTKKFVKLGIPKKELFTQSFVSPAQLEKLVWHGKDGQNNSLSKNQLQLINKEFSTKLSGAEKIIKEADADDLIDKPAEVVNLFKPLNQEIPEFLRS